MKKTLSIVLAIIVVLSCIPLCISNVCAESKMTLDQLKEKFPNGAYWNHLAKSGHGYNYTAHYGDACGDVENTYTWEPCTTHLEEPFRNANPGEVDCNSFAGGIQCWAFARKLASLAYGDYSYANYPDTTDKNTAVSRIKPGDIVCYNYSVDRTPRDGHWVFVIGVSGSIITLGECNYGCTCQISWGRKLNIYSLDAIKVYYAPAALTIDSHTHTYSSSITTQPTCTATGVRTFTCSCGSSYTETVAALGHAWDEGEIIANAGCTAEGLKQYTCTRCKVTKTEAVSAVGHTPVTDAAVEATCEHTGLTEGSHCSECQTVIVAQQEVPKAEHDYQLIGGTSYCDCVHADYECSVCHDQMQKTVYDAVSSDWLETKPVAVDDKNIETKTQYRASLKETTTATTPALEGWTPVGEATWKESSTGTVDYIEQFPAGFNTGNQYYTAYHKSVADTENETAKRTYDTANKTIKGYVYYHWCCSTYHYSGPSNHYISSDPGYDSENNRTYDVFHAFFSTTNYPPSEKAPACVQCSNASACNQVYWWFKLPVYTCSYTDYVKEYSFERWGDYSDWQDEKITENATTQVETREVWRICLAPLHQAEVTAWSTEKPTGVDESRIEEKKQYRYANKLEIVSTESEVEGYVLDPDAGFITYTDWVDGTWTATAPTESETLQITGTRTVTDQAAYKVYAYYHWWDVNSDDGLTYNSYANTWWKNYETTTSTTPFPEEDVYDGHQAYKKSVSGKHGNLWWIDSANTYTVPAKTHTEYFYQTRETVQNNVFYRWEDYSDWQDNAVEPNEDTMVESRTVYRYTNVYDHPLDETWESDEEGHWQVCTECDYVTEKQPHSGGQATASHRAVCEICGAEYGVLSDVMIGDVNSDGVVDSNDRATLARHLAGWGSIYDDLDFVAADIDRDGDITSSDRVILSRYLAGWGGIYDAYFA